MYGLHCVGGPYAGRRIVVEGSGTLTFKVGRYRGYYQRQKDPYRPSFESECLYWREVK